MPGQDLQLQGGEERLGGGVVEARPHPAHRLVDPVVPTQCVVKSVAVQVEPLSVWKTTPRMELVPPRTAIAIRIAAQARSASGCREVAAPRSRREYRSITVARYSLPVAVGISVMSPTHLVLGAVAVTSRRTRSGNFAAVLSCFVKSSEVEDVR